MSIEIKYPFTSYENYSYNSTDIEVAGGVTKLVPHVVSATSVLYAKLDDDNSGLVALDSSGNNRHGAFQGGLDENNWTTGKINSGIKGVSAVNGIINFDHLLTFERTDPFSLECWTKFTTSSSQALISKQENTGNITGFAVITLSGKLRFTINDSSGNTISVESVSAYNDDTFHHVVATYDGGSVVTGLNVYVDNVLSKTTIVADTLSSTIETTANLQVSGRGGNNLCILSTTKIDEVVIYDRELKAADVTFRWNSGFGTQELSGATTSFPIDNPVIEPVLKVLIDSIDDWASTEVETGSDSVTFTLLLNNISTYFDGSNWVVSDNSLVKTNTSAEIAANISTLVLSKNTSFGFRAFLHSDDGTTTPELSEVIVSISQESTSSVAPDECAVFGYIYDNQGLPVSGVTVSATLTMLSSYNSEIIISKNTTTTTTGSDGGWSLSLVENENMPSGIGYKFEFSGTGIPTEPALSCYRKIVPNQASKNFLELENLL